MEQTENGESQLKPHISITTPEERVMKNFSFPPQIRMSQLDFGKSLTSPNSVVPHLPQGKLLPARNFESPGSQPQFDVNVALASNGTPNHKKRCSCKQSKCLKLYCECFAFGVYCDGCRCADCYNKVENEAARQAAVKCILERNPYAFIPKIESSSFRALENVCRDEDYESPMARKHKRGCNCKKTGCLKKYCECFQANILCSENCKCVDCKNIEGRKEKLAFLYGDHSNNDACIQPHNAVISDSTDLLGKTFSSVLGKRTGHEFLDSNEKDSKIQRLKQHQDSVNPLRSSGPLSASSVDPVHPVVSSTLPSSTSTYRSLLADVIRPEDIESVCTWLVRKSGSAPTLSVSFSEQVKCKSLREKSEILSTALTIVEKNSESDQQELNNDVKSLSSGQDKENCRGEQDNQKVPANLSKENGTDVVGADDFKSEAYMKKERLVLGGFLGCLKKLTTIGDVKGRRIEQPRK